VRLPGVMGTAATCRRTKALALLVDSVDQAATLAGSREREYLRWFVGPGISGDIR
jgi:hypothetical protein